jgi:TonB-linked SusC/RagA family outer membrane protein
MKHWGKYVPILALVAVGLFWAAPVAAQTGSVTGTILDSSTGQPLDAVQVSLEVVGSGEVRYGGLSQASGRFLIINVPVAQYVLRAELLGFGTQTQVVDVIGGQATVIDFRMDPMAISLSEIVVTGVAGATQRTKLPFDVAQVRVSDLPVPSVSMGQAIQGKVAGALVVQGSGRPGAGASILLRGVTSLDASGRDQEPLYIVDGVILGSSMVDLDALDIQSVEVVKGAAAASLYGSRAGNGVIQIRTKRGAEMADDQVRYSFRSEFGGSSLGTTPEDLLIEVHPYQLTADGSQFVDLGGVPCDWINCASPQLDGNNAWDSYADNPWPGRTYNQVERFFTNGNFLQTSMTADGRSGRTNFHVSAQYMDQSGIMMWEPGYQRTNLRVNVDQAVVDNLTVQTSVFYSKSEEGTSDGPLFDLTRMPAGVDLLARDEDGELYLDVNPTNNESPNPMYALQNYDRRAFRSRFLGSGAVRYSPNDWLKFDSNVSFDRLDRDREEFRAKGYRTIDPSANINNGSLYKRRDQTEALNASITATAIWNPTDQIRNTSQVRYLYENSDYKWFDTYGYDFAVTDVPTFDNINADNVTAGSYLRTIRADGYFFITNFDMYDKYVVDALIRNDGSSLFGEDQRRQWYYRLGGAWRTSQEDWFNIDFFDDVKFRYSIGTAGGRPSFAAQYETYSVSGGRISPVTLGNKDLKPEFSTEHEVGVDMSMMNYKVNLALTYAQTTTSDQILPVPQASYTGFQTQWRNAGTIENKTWEATLDLRLMERPEFNWSAKLLFDHSTSTITELNVPPFVYGVTGQQMGNVFYAREGEKVGTFYGGVMATSCSHLPAGTSCDGFEINDDGFLVWTGGGGFSNPQWGTSGTTAVGGSFPMWGTPFGGYCIDKTTGEETQYCEVGNTLPNYNAGISSTMSWKGLSLYALVQRSSGFDVYNQPLQWGFFRQNTGPYDQSGVPEGQKKPLGYYDAWYGATGGLGPSSLFVEDGSFTKIREVSLSYRLNTDMLSSIPVVSGFSAVNFNLAGRNLFTWTDYRGYDPEIGRDGGDTGSAAVARVDGYQYPNFRTYTATVEFIF